MYLSFSPELHCWLDTAFLNAAAAKHSAISPFTSHYLAFLSWVPTVSERNFSWHTTASRSKEDTKYKKDLFLPRALDVQQTDLECTPAFPVSLCFVDR